MTTSGSEHIHERNHPRRGRVILLATLLAVWLAGALVAQSNQGSMSGTVMDSSGAVVPDVKITAKESASGTVYTAVSSSAGTYTFPNLRIGTYDVSAEYKGFKTAQSTGVMVQLSSTTSLNITLSPGQISETVTVSGSAPTVQGETSVMATVVGEKQILDLPLALGSVVQAMRSPEAFVFLTPGAIGPGTASGSGGTFESKINGGQTYGTEVLLDGANTTRSENGSSFDETAPSVDAIGEFSITTSTLPAEMGRTTGGIESFTLKAGTNAIHGSAYDIFRNEKLDANSFFDNQAGLIRPLDKQNDYGATFGGPVWVPKLYNGKNKTFFFFAWEQYRQNQGGVNNIRVPTAAEKSGDFSADLTSTVLGVNPCDGSNIYQGEIFDPATTKTVNGVQCRTAFAGNKIPTASLNAIGVKLMTYYPSPTSGAAAGNNFTYPYSFPVLDTSTSFRIDENLSDKSKLYFSYASRDNTRTSTTPAYNNAALDGRAQDFFTHYLRLGHDYVFTPTLLNHLNLGFNRTNSKNVGAGVKYGGNYDQNLGITGAGGPVFPGIGAGEANISGLGDTVNGDTIDNGFRLSDSVDWVHGKHTIKFGVDFEMQKYLPIDNSNGSGTFNFGRGETAGSVTTTGLSGNGIASMLLGQVDNANLTAHAGQAYWLTGYDALFVQDSIKVGRTLTLNLGLRWDMELPRRENWGDTSNISLTTPNPGANGRPGALVFAGTGTGRSGNVNERWAEIYKKDFGPRFGFAWSPPQLGHNTVVRGGFGIYYGNLLYADFGAYNRTGFAANPSVNSIDGFNPAFNISSGFPSYTRPPFLDPSQLNGAGGIQYIAPSYGRPPMVTNWSIEIQRQLATDLILDVAYVGTHGTHLRSNYDNVNSLPVSAISKGALLNLSVTSPQAVAAGIGLPYASFPTDAPVARSLTPFPQYLGFNTDGDLENLGDSTYNALQASLQRRFHNGLNLMAAYTWSKTLTDADSALPYFATLHGGGSAQNPFNLAGEKSLSNQDVPQTLVLSYIYELPVGKGKKFLPQGGVLDKIVGGWEFSGIHRYQSGQPVTFCCASGIPYFAGAIRYDQVLPSVYSSQYTSGNFNPVTDPMFNRAAFADPNAPARINGGGAYAFGTMTRTEGWQRMPMFMSEDFNLLKHVNITERVNALLQVNFINAFNRHIFNRPPDLNPNDSSFGIIDTSNTLETPRRVQLQLKLRW
jgi:hypothetical protein